MKIQITKKSISFAALILFGISLTLFFQNCGKLEVRGTGLTNNSSNGSNSTDTNPPPPIVDPPVPPVVDPPIDNTSEVIVENVDTSLSTIRTSSSFAPAFENHLDYVQIYLVAKPGKSVARIPVSIEASGEGNIIYPCANWEDGQPVTDDTGFIECTLSSNVVGIKEVYVTDAPELHTTVSFVAVPSADLSSITATPNSLSANGTNTTVTISLQEDVGNGVAKPVVNQPVHFKVNPSDLSIVGKCPNTDSQGKSTCTLSSQLLGIKTIKYTGFFKPGVIHSDISSQVEFK
jgi:hypothetical protein